MPNKKSDMVDGRMVRDQNGSHQRNITKLYRSKPLLSEFILMPYLFSILTFKINKH
mgnify:CR=1 FL=1